MLSERDVFVGGSPSGMVTSQVSFAGMLTSSGYVFFLFFFRKYRRLLYRKKIFLAEVPSSARMKIFFS